MPQRLRFRALVRALQRPQAMSKPGVLLAVGDYLGTLAAVRSLGRAGVEVTLADWRHFVAARWSRYAAHTLQCPDAEREPVFFLNALLAEGAQRPGQVLLATTDTLAWLFARHRELLKEHFRLDLPPLGAVYALLNKAQLAGHCEAVGLPCPTTRLCGDGLGPLTFPLVVKPQTQVLLSPHEKGVVVQREAELLPAVNDFVARTRYGPLLLESDPLVTRPMLQAYVEPSGGVYSLSGFIDASGERFTVRAARKVFQRPRRLGVGLCFEEAEVSPTLARGVRALCHRVGYHGVFEAEFLDGQLIDFNPRFYGQLAFDVARGLDLPLFHYLAATGDTAALDEALKRSEHPRAPARAYCDRIGLEVFLASVRAASPTDPAPRQWHDWVRAHRDGLADGIIDRDDWKPAVVAAVSSTLLHARHLRSTLRHAREV